MKYKFYTSKEIKIGGWMRRQLEIQAEGLCGNLDKVWPDVRDSKWIGGDREGWERVPYWLDGFIPLAYLLDDDGLKARAKKYIDAIVDSQRADGWICPCEADERSGYDTWAVQLISKVLTVYYECSGDERIPDVIRRIMKNYYELLKSGEIKLFNWGKFRWFESFITLNFLYAQRKEEWIVELARIIRAQGTDYSELTEQWLRPINKWTYSTHIVNICMMLKSEAVSCDLLGEEYTGLADRLDDLLKKYNGTPTEMYTGDECLSGLSPIQGTELCAVVEKMYALEQLYAYTGDAKWAEQLETVAFNALPATLSDDMWTHQYDQLSNQIECRTLPWKSVFRTNSGESHIFGLEPNYGCCTANFGQGWPKLALSAFMHNDGEIVSAVPLASELHDGGICIKLETEYPFKNELTYKISTDRDFRFRVRIPSFAERLTVNGRPATGDVVLDIAKASDITLNISFDAIPHFEKRSIGLYNVKCGSLIFAIPISYKKTMLEYEKKGVARKYPYCDYFYEPTSEWRYAYSGEALSLKYLGVSDVPFSSERPPVTVCAKVSRIDWEYEDGYENVCMKLPQKTEPLGEAEELELYPYGCAKLRITEAPRI